MKELKKYLQDLVDQHQIAGGALIIHKDGKELFHQWGDIAAILPDPARKARLHGSRYRTHH